MKHGSLFSGIGGFDLAAEWMGWENVFHCEWNPFGQKVLKHYWPKSISYENICTTDFSVHRGNIDILTGGFPCQPYSTAGKRLGKEDERHLFPEMLRAIKEIKPRWIVGENVRGLVSWNGGMVFHEVYDDLEREGYEVQSFLIPAAGVNAPHRRDRIWFVAHANNKRGGNGSRKVQGTDGEVSQWYNNAKSCDSDFQWDATDSKSNGGPFCKLGETKSKQQIQTRSNLNGFNELENAPNPESQRHEPLNQGGAAFIPAPEGSFLHGGGGYQYDRPSSWEIFPTVSPICYGDDGLSDRLDGITFSKWRRESIKAGGNAIVPNVVYQIFKAIYEVDGIANRVV